MKLLLTDSQHSLGVAIEHELEREPFHVVEPSSQDVDWRDSESVCQYISKLRPDFVINTLGFGDSQASADTSVLEAAASNLARACAEPAVPVIHLSSYRVFGDDNKSKHAETDTPEPNSALGKAFLDAEQVLLESLDKALVLRSSWLISSYGDNRLTHLLEALEGGKPWRLNSRLRGAPTALSDLARVTVALVKQMNAGAECWGIYQYCSGDACSEVELAEQLWETLQQQGYDSGEPQWDVIDEPPHQVPVSAVLGSVKIRNDFGVQSRTWRSYLVPIIKQWLSAHPQGKALDQR